MGEKELGMAAFALPAFQPATALTGNQYESRWEYPATSSAALTKPKERAFIFPSGKSTFRIVVTTNTIPTWVEPTVSAFIGIQTLPENWNSYGGKRINRDLISQSLSTLELIMGPASPAPSVVPLGDGGLQLEWHRNQQDLEIVFPADDLPHFYYGDKRVGTEQEGSASDVSSLAQFLSNIA
jgi:hypothetical protein